MEILNTSLVVSAKDLKEAYEKELEQRKDATMVLEVAIEVMQQKGKWVPTPELVPLIIEGLQYALSKVKGNP